TMLALSAFCGCTDGQGSVAGTVTFNGEPVKSGMITFVKQSGELVREGAVITDGNFFAHLPPGDYKIELNAQKIVGKRKQKAFDGSDEEVEIAEELFPEQYNTKTTLTTEIHRGSNSVKLNAKTK